MIIDNSIQSQTTKEDTVKNLRLFALTCLALFTGCHHYLRQGTFVDAETTTAPFYSNTVIKTRNFDKCIAGRQNFADSIGMCRNEEMADVLLGDAETMAARTRDPQALAYGLGGFNGLNGLGYGGGIGQGLSAMGGAPYQQQMMQLATLNTGAVGVPVTGTPIIVGGGLPGGLTDSEKDNALKVDAALKQSAENARRLWCHENPKDERCRD